MKIKSMILLFAMLFASCAAPLDVERRTMPSVVVGAKMDAETGVVNVRKVPADYADPQPVMIAGKRFWEYKDPKTAIVWHRPYF